MDGSIIETIYFGGGTPSVCTAGEIEGLITTIKQQYAVSKTAEITLEANPDDLNTDKLKALAQTSVNRLSIGVQSFFETDLQFMHRAHNAAQAKNSIEEAQHHFSNVSLDLIYGIPGLSNDRWRANLQLALVLGVPHISSYALTVEPNTVLEKQIHQGYVAAPKDASAEAHYHILLELLESEGFVNYEFSNFGKPGFFSQNNLGYWSGKTYLGIGPSAHSFNGTQRSWNVANNIQYARSLENGERNYQTETLTAVDLYNEYIMTGLRTMWGVSTKVLQDKFGEKFKVYFEEGAKKFLETSHLEKNNTSYHLTQKGKFLGDGIASDLFFLN